MAGFLQNFMMGQPADPTTNNLRQSVLNNFYNSNLANNVNNPMQPFPQPYGDQYGQTGQLGAGLRHALYLNHLMTGQQQQSQLEQQRQQAQQTPVRLDPGTQQQAAPAQQSFQQKFVPITRYNNQGLLQTQYYPISNPDIYARYQNSFNDNGTGKVGGSNQLSPDEIGALMQYKYQ